MTAVEAANNEGMNHDQVHSTDGHPVQETMAGEAHRKREDSSTRIYILGAGNLGLFVAHSLAGIPARPPLTLLLRRIQLDSFTERGCSIDVTTRGVTETRRQFDKELILPPPQNRTERGRSSHSVDSDPSSLTEAGGSAADSIPLTKPTRAFSDEDQSARAATDKSSLDDSNAVREEQTLPDMEGRNAAFSPTEGGVDADSIEAKQDVINDWFAKAESEGLEQDSEDNARFPTSGGGLEAKTSDDLILNLVVSVKAPHTVGVLRNVAQRLTRESTIVFLQNGMGILDEVNQHVFPDEKNRPTYIIGVVSHGLYSTRPFSVIHAGEGTIALGVMPRMPMVERKDSEPMNQLAPSARYLLRTFTRTPIFVAVGFPPTDLLQQQLDKLAVNCIINPLTALMDCKNGGLLSSFHFTRVIRLLLAEISLVIKSLPELKVVPNVKMRFDSLRLERLVYSVAKLTAANRSSMVQDFRTGKETEIDYLNGYIVKRGEQMGIHCVMNYMLLHVIKGKRKYMQEQIELLPFADDDRVK